MVWVNYKEKFHGKNIKGSFWKKHTTAAVARKNVKRWNSFTPQDHLTILSIRKNKPKGLKRKYKGVYEHKGGC